MKNTLLIVMFIACLSIEAYSKDFFYFSPGITVGWNFGNGLTFTPRISVGMVNSYYEYYSLTYSYNYHSKKNDDKFNYKDYHSVELQSGSVMYGIGGGAGFAVFNAKNAELVVPKVSLFAGFGLYANIDMLFLEDKLNTNLGIQAVLPVVFTRGTRFGIGRY